jgi:hypothetical protein
MDTNWHNGSTGEATLEVMAYFLDLHLGLASRLFMKLGLSVKIERNVINAYRKGLIRRRYVLSVMKQA